MGCFPGEQVPGPDRFGQTQEEAVLHMCREGCSAHLAAGCPYGLQQERAPVWAAPCCLLHKPPFFPLVLGYTEVWKKVPWVNKVSVSIFQGVGEGNHGHPELLVDSGSIKEDDVFLSTCEKTEVLLEKALFLWWELLNLPLRSCYVYVCSLSRIERQKGEMAFSW